MSDETLIVDSVPDPDDEIEVVRAALAPDYEIVEELGRGGMAVVYRAREPALDREVAVKVLPLARTFDAEFVERFQREARMAASLEHPHIIPIYRVGQADRVSFFAMKYVRGESLADRLQGGERLEPEEVERILVEVGEALDHAHAHGVIHRDLKPDNVMKDQTGRYVVMDFGIAKSVGTEQLTQTGGSIGTPKYMSPEQGRGLEVDGRSDLYSLGVVAYHCLAGRPPFEGGDALSVLYSHLHDPVPEPSLASDRDRQVYAVIHRLLAKDPDDRLQSGEEIRNVLDGSASAGSTSPGTPGSASTSSTASVSAASISAVTEEAAGWLRSRTKRFWASAGAVASVLFLLFGRGGARAECRAAIPDATEGDRAVLIEPLETVRQGSEIDVAYIVCGVPDEMSFRAQVIIRAGDGGGVVGGVRRLFGGDRSPVRVSWDGVSKGFATSGSREIDPGELDPGSYRITVSVDDESGRKVEASHDFTVVDR